MWTASIERPAKDGVLKFALCQDRAPISVREVLRCWQSDSSFLDFFIDLLSSSPFEAFRWETPPVTSGNCDRQFEFVLLDSPGLARSPDVTAFDEHFVESADVVEFKNLGGDAILVVPCPRAEVSAYGHIAAFVRNAPVAQKHALWQAVGSAMDRRLENKPVWLSTAGAGVSWLHVRLDDFPKYYGHAPYRSASY